MNYITLYYNTFVNKHVLNRCVKRLHFSHLTNFGTLVQNYYGNEY